MIALQCNILIVVLICIFLVSNEAEYLFMHLMQIAYLWKRVSKSLAHLKWG